MNHRQLRVRFRFALTALLFVAPSDSRADEIEVAVESAEVKVREVVVAIVKRGQRYPVLQVKGPWIAVAVGHDDARREGWILADKVRRVLDPAITDQTPAPGPPVSISVSADLTQVVLVGDNAYLFCQLSIANETVEPLRLAAAELALNVDGERLHSKLPPPRNGPWNLYTDAQMRVRVSPRELPLFQDREVGPGERAEGWVVFELKPLGAALHMPGSLGAKSWLLTGQLGGHRFEFDLKANEVRALNAACRPATSQPEVRVIEIGPRLNALNLAKLVALVKEVPRTDHGYVLLLRQPQLLVDTAVFQQWRDLHQPDEPPVAVVPPDAEGGSGFNYFLQRFRVVGSEKAGSLLIVGRRAHTAAALIPGVADDETATRAAAAEALAAHLTEPMAMESVIAAAGDHEPAVRVAAIRSLGRGRIALPAGARQNDSPDTTVLVRAMEDSEARVRNAAAEAAAVFDTDRVKQSLSRMLDDGDLAVRIRACQSLGALHVTEAGAQLKELATSGDRGLRTAAIDALQAISALSPVEAILEKFDGGVLTPDDFQLLVQARDPRSTPKLIAALNGNNYFYGGLAAKALADMGEKAAVEPILKALADWSTGADRQPLVDAIGKLGDPRAIGPLRKALARAPADRRQRLAYYQALIAVGDAEALSEVAAMLKRAESPAETVQALFSLGQAAKAEVIPIIEPYLDQEAFCAAAARALISMPASKGLPPVEKRLLSADYAFGRQLIEGLSQNSRWLRSAEGSTLLEKAAASPNPVTRQAAASFLGPRAE